ncbi:MAG: Uma2 family endonuclease [Planctomycetota bacterium]|nr:Uma2 family endonuclease [Planctomycetota bacterium]
MSTTTDISTAEQLWQANLPQRCELVRGELRMMSPTGGEHGVVTMNMAAPMATFVKQHRLGYVFGAETGFIIARDPDSVRAPDVAFVRNDRVEGKIPQRFFPGAPDIAVEVLSPSESDSDVCEKTEAWLAGGCSEVWLVNPQRKTAFKCTVSGKSVDRKQVETFTSDLLPGFRLEVAELFQLD